MKRGHIRKLTILFFFGILMLTAGYGCNPKDVPVIIDEDELLRYMNETEDGRELFRTDGLIPSSPYQTPVDNAIWSDSVLAHKRVISVNASDGEADYGSLGFLREGVVLVNDQFTVETTRLFPDSTVVDTTVRTVLRDAFFLKLGGDSRPFVGWLMWGYNGIGEAFLPVNVWMRPDTSQLFFGDKSPNTINGKLLRVGGPFIALTDIRALGDGESIVCSTATANSQTPVRTYQVLTFAEGSGFAVSGMKQIDRMRYIDTISTPTANPRLWNIIYFQSFDDQTRKLLASWTVPYRIPQ